MKGLDKQAVSIGVKYTDKENANPRVSPTERATRMRAKPRAIFVESVNSPIVLLTTPNLPLKRLEIHRLNREIGILSV